MDRIIKPVQQLRGTIEVPGDKSISHRALIIGALCKGSLKIQHLSSGRDVESTISCLKSLGVSIKRQAHEIQLEGQGLFGFSKPPDILDAGNSGTTVRLLTGVLAGQRFSSSIAGDESLKKRDMKRIVKPLAQMGAEIHSEEGHAPLHVAGRDLHGIIYKMPMASAQVKSCILLAGLHATGETTIIEPSDSRDHTERMLQYFGAPVKRKKNTFTITGKTPLTAKDVIIPGDFSSAAFFMAAAILAPNADLLIRNVGINPSRTQFLRTLQKMGVSFEIKQKQETNNEPLADIHVTASKISGLEISGNDIPLLIDELPILAVMATQAEGTTIIKDARELRAKESDRIASVALNLKAMGADVEELPDGLIIHGPTKLNGARLKSFSDHRVVMAFAVAGLVAEGETMLEEAEWADVSFPGFFEKLHELSQS